MKKKLRLLLLSAGIIVSGLFLSERFFSNSVQGTGGGRGSITLPSPKHRGKVSLEETIFKRRATRVYKNEPLTLDEVSQLLWAAGGKTIDGITGATRSYPSAGGLYPLEIYLVAGKVDGLASGIYHYNWERHTINRVKGGDLREQLTLAALGQKAVANAPISIVITAVYSRTTRKYGKRGEVRYVPMDMGSAGQNIHLQAEALGLGTGIIGAFEDEAVERVLGVKEETPLYIMPVGRK